MDKLNEREILRRAVREQETTQANIAKELGVQQNALSAKMTRERMSVDTFKAVLNVLGYDIVVVDRISGERKWLLETEK